MHKAVW